MKKSLAISNGIALVIMVVISYLSNTGVFGGNTMATISAKYPTLFTPAAYAFAIWGLIYLALAGFVIFQGRTLLGQPEAEALVGRVGWWFVISCLANSAWVLAWLYDQTGLSVLIMIVLFYSLLKIILRTDMELTDPPLRTIAFVWWPFCLYSGWISVALIANVAVWLTKLGWQGFILHTAAWAVIMIIVAGVVHLFMTWRRNMREFAFVGVWALVAIAIARQHENGPVSVIIAAYTMAGILFLSSSLHGYKNRALGPFRKR
jgi:hypothetical protein